MGVRLFGLAAWLAPRVGAAPRGFFRAL